MKSHIKVALFRKDLIEPQTLKRLQQTKGRNFAPYANLPYGRYFMSITTNTKEKLAEWVYSVGGVGFWYALSWRKKRCKDNKVRICYGKKLFLLEIWRDEGQMTYEVYETKGLRPYGFWRKKLIPLKEISEE